MMITMKRKLFRWTSRIILVVVLLTPTMTLAARDDTEREPVDARLEGYKANVTLEGGSTGLTWALLVVLGGIVFAGLFKDSKRSHLD